MKLIDYPKMPQLIKEWRFDHPDDEISDDELAAKLFGEGMREALDKVMWPLRSRNEKI